MGEKVFSTPHSLFLKHINSKKEDQGKCEPTPNGVGALVMKDTTKAMLLNIFFASIFIDKDCVEKGRCLFDWEESGQKSSEIEDKLHRIIELLMLEKTLKIIRFKHNLIILP